MNRRFKIAIGLSCILFLGYVGLEFPRFINGAKPQDGHGNLDSTVDKKKTEQNTSKKSLSTTVPPKGSIQRLEQEIRQKQMLLSQAFRTEINFYGKVVDERGKPVSGASVSYTMFTRSFQGSPTVSGPTSSNGGTFSILGVHGSGIYVKVRHPNYYSSDLAQKQFTFSSLLAKDGEILPTSTDPAIFVLNTKGVTEPLIHRKSKIRLPIDGTPTDFVLQESRDGNVKDVMRLTLLSKGNQVPKQQYYPFDWTLKIEVPGGGIRKRVNQFDFIAPLDDYQKAIKVSEVGTTPRGIWNESLDDDFFVLLPSKAYARIKIRMIARRGSCAIEVFVNPNPESRNLESDPSSVDTQP